MNSKKLQLDNYRKHLLNRVTASLPIIEYIENCLASEIEATRYTFHKVMVHNWSGNDMVLYEMLSEYFSPNFIPVNYTHQGDIASFHTSSLSLVLKLAKLDFMFPYQRNMFNVDILFNDKSSADCFDNRVSIEDIVTSVVSNRMNDKFELDLSNFCNDAAFQQNKICFYKFSLLSNYKILMLRMGRDTRTLNLSNNNLSLIPAEILNFFIKGDLIAINLSNNNIPSLTELHRVSSKIEKLWVEGNPLCNELDAITYVKQITMKFPRLNELDGIRLNEHGVLMPFFKNFLIVSDKKTKMLIDKFLSLYFAYYDSRKRRKIESFYDLKAKLAIVTDFKDSEEAKLPHYASHSRNILHTIKRKYTVFNNKLYSSRDAVVGTLSNFPETLHDPTTFTVDVLKHDKKSLILIVDGVFKERGENTPEYIFRFRRTFVFNVVSKNPNTTRYFIINEHFNISFATKALIDVSFQNPTINTNPLALKSPDRDDIETICNIYSHFTKLKRSEAELRLKRDGWDIIRSLRLFTRDLKNNSITSDKFIDFTDDFSDTSSLIDEID